jgi:hypothetical protein
MDTNKHESISEAPELPGLLIRVHSCLFVVNKIDIVTHEKHRTRYFAARWSR